MKNPFLLWNKLRGIISNEKKEKPTKERKAYLIGLYHIFLSFK